MKKLFTLILFLGVFYSQPPDCWIYDDNGNYDLCEGLENLDDNSTGTEICSWLIDLWGDDCLSDCGEDDDTQYLYNICQVCIDTGNCDEMFDDEISGCTYPEAINYNPDATDDDGSCEFIWGDMNHDGTLNVFDVIFLVNAILSGNWL